MPFSPSSLPPTPPDPATDPATDLRANRQEPPTKERRGVGSSFWLYDALPIGGVAVALLLGTSALLGVPADPALLAMAFCGTALVYTADRSLGLSPEDVVNRPGRVAWVRRNQAWLRGEAIVLAMGAAGSALWVRESTLLVAVGLGGVALLHVVPVLPGMRRLKAVGAVKPIAIAVTWSVGAAVLPVVEAGQPVTIGVGALVVYRFAFILPNVVVADWADRAGDAAAGLPTWADGWCRPRVLQAVTALLLVGIGGAGVATAFGPAPPLLLLDAAGLAGMIAAVWTLRPGRDAAHLVALDLMVAWPGLVWIAAWIATWVTA